MVAMQEAISSKLELQSIINFIRFIGNFAEGITNAATGNYTQGISAVSNYVTNQMTYQSESWHATNALLAKKADVANALDIPQFVSADANKSLTIQDYVFINECSYIDSEVASNILENIYSYGIPAKVTSNLSGFSHQVFNYVKYSNFECKTITNDRERKAVENILNRGVTIWSTPTLNENATIHRSKLHMSKSCANLPIGIY